ncbi:Cytochrome P450 [Mycena venus]|uniref:Cytochrome P450 n=1 Tax=Mycena venus TaxID=2733690 RepID=A0A8H6Z273_9AGAR|nr:Cytochrome P450 [Mycena venus]
MPQTFDLLLVALTAWAVVFVLRFGHRQQGLPPGPPTVPLLGNAHMLPRDGKDMYFKLTEWARRYGDIFSVRVNPLPHRRIQCLLQIKVGSGTMIVLSSPTAIKEIVDKSGWAGSARPKNYIAELCGSGGEFNILFTSDCERLRNLRRTFARFFSPQNILRYVPVQIAESTLLLDDLIAHPEDFSDSIRRFSHSLAKIMAYGRRAQSFHDDEVQRFYTSLDEIIHALTPGVYPPFDLLPVFKYIPPPFAPWRAFGRRIAAVRTGIHTRLYEDVWRRQAAGDEESIECFIGKIIQDGVPEGEEEFYSYTGLALLDAGSDTSGAFLLSLVLCLAVFPEYQERAREEMDAVVGIGRLPTLEDFPKLPYLNAFVKEILRFRPQFPMGLQYKDHLVPKGSVVVLNTYGVFHDPEIFEDPEAFNPERFLNSEFGTRPDMDTDLRDNLAFGGGRRICPGQWVARSTIHLASMHMVWALKFSEARDSTTGEPILQDLDCYTNHFVVMPRPFKCKIEPRTTEHRNLVAQARDDAKQYLSRYETT